MTDDAGDAEWAAALRLADASELAREEDDPAAFILNLVADFSDDVSVQLRVLAKALLTTLEDA
jgi:hypothetical protein